MKDGEKTLHPVSLSVCLSLSLSLSLDWIAT